MYFRNKFDEEFFNYCKHIQPRGASTNINDCSSLFFEFKQNPHTKRVLVIPLVLYNKLSSSNNDDVILEDKAALCLNSPDTIISCEYDETYAPETNDFVCDITKPSGDYIE